MAGVLIMLFQLKAASSDPGETSWATDGRIMGLRSWLTSPRRPAPPPSPPSGTTPSTTTLTSVMPSLLSGASAEGDLPEKDCSNGLGSRSSLDRVCLATGRTGGREGAPTPDDEGTPDDDPDDTWPSVGGTSRLVEGGSLSEVGADRGRRWTS